MITARDALDVLPEDRLLYYFKLYKENNDMNARNIIIESNIKLAIRIASKKYYNLYMENEDVMSASYIGLIKAVDTFDINKNFKFAGYAYTCIKNEIGICLRENRNKLDFISLEEENFISLEEEIKNSKKEVLLKDLIKDNIDIEKGYEKKEMYMSIKDTIEMLPDKDKEIIKMTYYEGLKEIEIAEKLNLTCQAISLRLISSLKKLAFLLRRNGIIKIDLEDIENIRPHHKRKRLTTDEK